MTEPPQKKRLPANLWALSAASFLTDVSSEMIFNVLPLFLTNVLGVRTATVGVIEGIAETTSSLMKIVSGIWSDRISRRKELTVAGYLLSTLAKPFLYFANTWTRVLAVRFTDRLGKGIRTAPRDSLLASSLSEEQRGLAFGLHRAADTAGAFTGLALATLILWLSQGKDVELTRPAFQNLVLASILPAVLAVLILIVGVHEIRESRTEKQSDPTSKAPWRNLGKTYMSFLAVMVLFTLGNSSDAFIILRGQDRGLNVLQIMGMLLTFNAVYALLSGPAGALSDRVGRRRVLLAGWVIYGLVYLGFALAKEGWQVWLLFTCYGVFYALTEGVARAQVADLVTKEQRGSAYGFYHAAIGISALPASLIAGILWQGIGGWSGLGASAPFMFGALMALLAALLLRFWVPLGKIKPTSINQSDTS